MQLDVYGIVIQIDSFSTYLETLFITEYSYWNIKQKALCDEKIQVRILKKGLDVWDISNAMVLNTDKNKYFFKNNIVYVMTHDKSMVAQIDTASNNISLFLESEHIEAYFFCKAVLNALVAYIFKKNNIHRIHGAVLTKGNKVIIVLGQSGSGKSTSAYYLHKAGFEFYGDDILYITFNNDNVEILPYPNCLSTDLCENNYAMRYQDGYRMKAFLPIVANNFPVKYQLYMLSLSLSTNKQSVLKDLSFSDKTSILNNSFVTTPFEHFSVDNNREKFEIIYSIINTAKFKKVILGLEEKSFVEIVNELIENPV